MRNVYINHALTEAYQQLATVTATPQLEAMLLLAYVLKCDKAYLIAHNSHELSDAEQFAFQALVAKRLEAVPLAYLIGSKEFWSLPLLVTPDVLIPRPDTELLVEVALATLPATALCVLDLGTGSGAIALALAKERPAWQVMASDIAPAALAIARQNAQLLNLAHIELRESDCFAAWAGQRFNAIISNPPYLASEDPHLADLSYEPQHALVAGATGLEMYAQIIAQAANYLEPDGYLLFEHGARQADEVRKLLLQHHFHACQTFNDIEDRPRVTIAKSVK